MTSEDCLSTDALNSYATLSQSDLQKLRNAKGPSKLQSLFQFSKVSNILKNAFHHWPQNYDRSRNPELFAFLLQNWLRRRHSEADIDTYVSILFLFSLIWYSALVRLCWDTLSVISNINIVIVKFIIVSSVNFPRNSATICVFTNGNLTGIDTEWPKSSVKVHPVICKLALINHQFILLSCCCHYPHCCCLSFLLSLI